MARDENMKNKVWILILLIIIVPTLALIISILFDLNNNVKINKGNNNKNEYGNQIFNMTSYSNNILKYGNWVIFSNGIVPLNTKITNYKEGIYKYNIKTGQVIKLYDYNGYCLNLKDDDLYFCTTHGQIYNVNLESLKYNWLSDIKDVSYLLVYNDNIYYRTSNGNNIYSATISGNNQKLVAEYTSDEFQVYNGYIYYIDSNSNNVLKKSIQNTEENPVKIIEEKVINFYIVNDKIIYSSENKINLYDLNNNTEEKLVEDVSSNFIFNNNKLYFYSENKRSIIESDINTKQENSILENLDKVYRLQNYDNYIFYYNTTGKYPYMSTQLYYLDINNKNNEKLSFSTK